MRTLFLLFSLLTFSSLTFAQSEGIKLDWQRSASLYYNGGPTQVNAIAAGNDGSVTAVGYIHNTVDFEPGPDTVAVMATGTYDIFIARYNKTGHLVYALHFGEKASTVYEAAYAVTTDNDGNAYVTGNFSGTIDFDPGKGTALLSAVSKEIFIASYDKNGLFRYAIKATNTASDNKVQNVKSIAIDKQRNVYITGSFIGSVDFDPGNNTAQLGSSGSLDIFFAKYDAKGNYRFAKKMGGESDDMANDIAIDKNNNTVLCGQFASSPADFDPGAGKQLLSTHGNADIFFAKYDTAGNYMFAKQIGALSDDVANALAISSDNSIVITGFFRGKNVDFDAGAGSFLINSNYIDAFVTKYKSNGDFDYVFSIGGVSNDNISDVAIDSNNNYFVTGTFFGSNVDFDPGTPVYNVPTEDGQRKFMAKYTGAGALVFANSIGTASKDDNMYTYAGFNSLAVDKSGNLLAGGNFADTLDVDPGAGQHLIYEPYLALLIVSYNSDGTYKNSISTDNYFDYYNASSTVQASATDDSGNVYTAGTINGRFDFDPGPDTYILESENDYRASLYFAKYNKRGELVYAKAIIGGWFITGMALDKDNDIYITGVANGRTDFDPGSGTEYWNNNTFPDGFGHFFAKYSNAGGLLYAKGIGSSSSEYSTCIAVDKQKNVYVAGVFGYDAIDFDPGPGKKILTPSGGNDMFYSRYDSAGNYVYAYNVGQSKATDIKLSFKQNLVICGYMNGNNIDFDPGSGQSFLSGLAFVATYRNDGSFINAFAISTANGGYGSVNMNTLALDTADNVYIAGDYSGKVDFDPGPQKKYIKEGNGIFVASYNKTGQYRFAKGAYGYPENTTITRIALDKNRNIYTIGYFSSPVLDLDFDPDSAFIYNEASDNRNYSRTDLFLAKYDSLCNYTYGYDIDGDSAYGFNNVTSLNVEKNGNIIIGGSARAKLDFDVSVGENLLQPTAIYDNLFVAQYWPVGSTGFSRPTFFTSVEPKPTVAETGILSVSPNPATDYIVIRINHLPVSSSAVGIKVYNAGGTCVLAKQAAINDHSLQSRLSLTHLPKGSYFLTVTEEGQVCKSSFVIQ